MTDVTCLPASMAVRDNNGGEVGRAVREVLAEAGAVGERAATWVEALAVRQSDGAHRRVLEMFAGAVRRVLGREIVPGGSGEVSCGLRYRLDAYVVLGAAGTGGVPDLTGAEQLALLAVGAVATTAPSTVVGDVEADLPRCVRSSTGLLPPSGCRCPYEGRGALIGCAVRVAGVVREVCQGIGDGGRTVLAFLGGCAAR
ncbi:hypothetical protein OG689_42555 [Kitasatospora sp. NBC_00240]|uniref:hypothetical protein n=1 Tax=Kitasatospora sp. NBC_00240 TaxID=2903567 RepID=UPI00225BEC6B|nr:hypothetical protein [Kitasatospora sp. NBC_00240]MCX5215834.1 hypothetical protein [Kitasatospora sp. NBC_00240]